MPGTTTDGDPIAATNFARPAPTTPSPTSPSSGSDAGPSSVASSTNTNSPRRSPGQGRWPSSGTPQAGRRFRDRGYARRPANTVPCPGSAALTLAELLARRRTAPGKLPGEAAEAPPGVLRTEREMRAGLRPAALTGPVASI